MAAVSPVSDRVYPVFREPPVAAFGPRACSLGTPRRAPQPRSHQQSGRGRHGPIAQLVERTADNREVSGSNPLRPTNPSNLRGCSSAGRAPGLQPGGRRFEPGQLHQPPRAGLDERSRQRSAVPFAGRSSGGAFDEEGHCGSTRARGSLTTEDSTNESVKGVVPTTVFHAV